MELDERQNQDVEVLWTVVGAQYQQQDLESDLTVSS